MRAEIVSIGDELTSGQRLDTNSQWLSRQLADLGVSTLFHTTVGDSLSDHVDTLRTAARRVDLVVCTGGLGPTADDLTREAFAEAFGKPLELRPEALAHIEHLFARRRRPMAERNRVQAMFPRDSLLIPNPHGTAPGIDLTVDGGCRFFALPGVPAEMMQMWRESVLPRLMSDTGIGKQRWFYRSLKVFGIGESDVEARLPDLIRRDRIPRVGITVSKATITLRIACLAENEAQAIEASQATEDEIREALGGLVFGTGEQELDEMVHQQLLDRGQSLGVIEYGGQAIIGHWLAAKHTSISSQPADSSSSSPSLPTTGLKEARWYRSLLGCCNAFRIPCRSIAGGDDWSTRESLHRQIALAARNELATDWLLLVGPFPTQDAIEDTESMPTCELVIALIGPDEDLRCEKFEIGGHPELLVARLAKTGLDYFRKHSK